jgi:hypothetical protein
MHKEKNTNVWVVKFENEKLNFKIKKKYYNKNMGCYVPKPVWYKQNQSSSKRHFISINTLKKHSISAKLKNCYINENESWSKVKRVEKGSVTDVYDLSIENVHSFVVGGNVVHNCFQEQISKVCKDIGQMDAEAAENVRIAMGKKQMQQLQFLKHRKPL